MMMKMMMVIMMMRMMMMMMLMCWFSLFDLDHKVLGWRRVEIEVFALGWMGVPMVFVSMIEYRWSF